MSGTVADKKRLFRVTAGNLRQSHLYINGHYDFFPGDCIGASRKSTNGNGVAIREIDRFPEADVGGLPYQGFSNLGERVPNDPRNQLWRQFMRAVEDGAQKAFVA